MDVTTAGTALGATQGASTQTQAASQAASAKLSSDFQTFLVMLTTQMQNQDPLNPIDSTDFATQLATFSGVEQQVQTNALLESLSDRLGLSGLTSFAGWVGMEARVDAAVGFDGAPLTLFPAPSADADQAVLVGFDANGREVSRGQVPLSTDPVTWAGTDARGAPLPAGAYRFQLENYSAGELISISPVEVFGRITEVRNSTAGAILVLDGGAEVAPDAVRALREAAGG
jgi:flagellar basal-body rod modification protein FlgD